MSPVKKLLNLCIVAAMSGQSYSVFAGSNYIGHESSVETIEESFVDEEEFDDSLEDFYGDEDFISLATGSKQLIRKAPSVASVITADDIRNMGARNIVDVLDTVPGLHVSRSGQLMAPEFWFRGISTTFTPQTLFMINGVSTKSSMRGDNHVMWGKFPIHAIERIEVIRGPGSALYGADAFSGVINVITKKSNTNSKNEVGAKIGSFSTRNVWANNSFSAGNWNISTNFEFLESDGFDAKITQDSQSIIDGASASLGVPPASLAPGFMATSFESLDIWISANSDLFSIELGVQDRGNLGQGPGGAEAIDTKGRGASYKRIASIGLKEQNITDNLLFGGKASYYGSSQEIESDLLLFPQGAFFGSFPDGFIGNPGWEEETTHVEIHSRFTGFEKVEIKFGTGYERQNLYKVTEEKNFTSAFAPRPNGLEDVSDTDEVFIPEADRESHYVYLQGVAQLAPDWELTAGARYDDYSDFGSTVNPRLALVWSTSHDLTSKILYGRAFRAPSFAELLTVNNPVALGNKDLEPETIDTIEVAFDYAYSPQLSINFNIYRYKIDDLITFLPDNNNITSSAKNQGKRSGSGFETSLVYSPNSDFTLHSNIAYANAEDDLANKDVGEYPGIQGYIRGEWSVSEYLKLNTQISYIGDRKRVPGDYRKDIDNFTLVNLSSNYQFVNSGIRAELILTNIFDADIREPSSATTTFEQINIPNDLPQAGRGIYLEISTLY